MLHIQSIFLVVKFTTICSNIYYKLSITTANSTLLYNYMIFYQRVCGKAWKLLYNHMIYYQRVREKAWKFLVYNK